MMADKETSIRTPKAVEALHKLSAELAERVPAYADAIQEEREIEQFCQSVRAELRRRRIAGELDQTQLGQRADLSQSAISKIEKGTGDIGLKTVFRLAKALGLQPIVAFVPDGEMLLRQFGCNFNFGEQHGVEWVQAVEKIEIIQRDMVQSMSDNYWNHLSIITKELTKSDFIR